jgi:prolyl oligopeptidase family protein
MSSSLTKTAPYGSWKSPITSELIVAQSITLSEVWLDGGHVYWLEGRPNWGVVDVDDCVAGARFLAAQGRVDRMRCVISGGSAGGYTTLAALTFRDFFQGGASYYGVSDIAALARDTHKFESRYLDWLIGRYPQEQARVRWGRELAAAVYLLWLALD